MSEKIQEFAVVRLGYAFIPYLDQVFCVSCTKEKQSHGDSFHHAIAILSNMECYGCSIVMHKSHDTVIDIDADSECEDSSEYGIDDELEILTFNDDFNDYDWDIED